MGKRNSGWYRKRNEQARECTQARAIVGMGTATSNLLAMAQRKAQAELIAEKGLKRWNRLCATTRALEIGRRIRTSRAEALKKFEDVA